MIVFTPVDLPKIEPDNWDVFWDIWNTHSTTLTKVKMNAKSTTPIGTNSIWVGLDIYKKMNFPFAYTAPFFDIANYLPKMHEAITKLPVSVCAVRLVQSTTLFESHTDDNKDQWNLRAFLHGNDVHKQWYFTRPDDAKGTRSYIDMPSDTNWFTYNDGKCWHGTDYDSNNKKILLQVFSLESPKLEVIQSSIEKYKDYTIEF
jgi:hypothetical protein